MNYLQNTCLYTRIVYTHDNVLLGRVLVGFTGGDEL